MEDTMEERQNYEKKMEAQLHEYAEKLGALIGKAEKATADLRTQLQAEIDRLQVKQSLTRQELSRLRASGGDAWQDVRGGLERAWRDLKESIDQAMSRFK